MAGVWSWPLTS